MGVLEASKDYKKVFYTVLGGVISYHTCHNKQFDSKTIHSYIRTEDVIPLEKVDFILKEMASHAILFECLDSNGVHTGYAL